SVMFVEPKDGATVPHEFKVVMAVEGTQVAPPGQLVHGPGTHHLIIDGQPAPKGTVVPADATHLHFGKGQTETMLKLTPGKHTLTLQFADGAHQSYGPDLSSTITVEVK
ncbi:MAG: DUF4399 domain-containing protein, partial [Rhodocyclaceae bacterium]|nr:DUF4399 domain-containing protein [Rhodocyclaceae bacterium]